MVQTAQEKGRKCTCISLKGLNGEDPIDAASFPPLNGEEDSSELD